LVSRPCLRISDSAFIRLRTSPITLSSEAIFTYVDQTITGPQEFLGQADVTFLRCTFANIQVASAILSFDSASKLVLDSCSFLGVHSTTDWVGGSGQAYSNITIKKCQFVGCTVNLLTTGGANPNVFYDTLNFSSCSMAPVYLRGVVGAFRNMAVTRSLLTERCVFEVPLRGSTKIDQVTIYNNTIQNYDGEFRLSNLQTANCHCQMTRVMIGVNALTGLVADNMFHIVPYESSLEMSIDIIDCCFLFPESNWFKPVPNVQINIQKVVTDGNCADQNPATAEYVIIGDVAHFFRVKQRFRMHFAN
jgi:hypothetical protein